MIWSPPRVAFRVAVLVVVGACLWTGCATAPSSVEDVEITTPTGWTPLQLSLRPHQQMCAASRNVNGLRLGVAGRNHTVRGVDLSLGYTITDGDVWGVQLAPFLGNRVGSLEGDRMHPGQAMRGVQVGLGANFANVYGVQIGALNGTNPYPEDDIIRPIAEVLLGEATEERHAGFLRGLQVGGSNVATDAVGLQLGGASFADSMTGAQVAVGENRTGSMRGLQLGGWNRADSLGGAQFGVVSFADEIRGTQLGIWNGGRQLRRAAIRGVQIGGISFGGQVRGGQVSVVNLASAGRGAQVGGLNVAEGWRGVQVGVFNTAKELRGVQVGLWNVNDGGWLRNCPIVNVGW